MTPLSAVADSRPGLALVVAAALWGLLLSQGCGAAPPGVVPLPPMALQPLGAPGVTDRRAEFADLFCSVLRHLEEGSDWGSCDEYLDRPEANAKVPPSETASSPPIASEGPLAGTHRLLIISGIMSKCLSPEVQAFSDGSEHLRSAHGFEAEYLDVSGLGGCEHNAGEIAAYIERTSAADPRPVIVLGYSKGAPDLQVMLQRHPEARRSVAALVSVAGSVAGSPIAGALPKFVKRAIDRLDIPARCGEGDSRGFESLERKEREEFLSLHPCPPVPSYSVAAVCEAKRTSTALMGTRRILDLLALEQDGQVLLPDAILPGAAFLGIARADHWAVALPFGDDHPMKPLVEHNRYPRAALLEAIARFVLADLERRAPRAACTEPG